MMQAATDYGFLVSRRKYEKAPQPKELIVLDGSAHAQFLFQTNQADRVMREILRFLSAK